MSTRRGRAIGAPTDTRHLRATVWSSQASTGLCDEIAYVIKGRGITQFEQYVDLSRTGRACRPLATDQRRAVWDLYTACDAELRAAGVDTVKVGTIKRTKGLESKHVREVSSS